MSKLVRTEPLSRVEFIALMAMIFATMAFSIDSMLPALPQIAAEMSPDDPNRAQLVVTAFVLGMGLGTLFTGPLSDAFGRKPVVVAGGVVYCIGALAAANAGTLETILAARAVMGMGAAGARVVTLAIIRDLYSGRAMAQTMSFVMMVFTIVPALAPTIGSLIIDASGWHGLFIASMAFSLFTMIWLTFRQPETLPRERRIPLRPVALIGGITEVLSNPIVVRATLVQTLVAGVMFAMISSTQQIFAETFGHGDDFHLWFAGIALFAASGTLLNAALVMRLGMRTIVNAVLAMQLVLSGIMVVTFYADLMPEALQFPAFVVWMGSIFFMISLGMGNMNALAMEPVGHVAGLAASVIGCVSTVLAVVIAVPIGLMFDGTILPLATGVFICIALAFGILQTIMDTPKEVESV